MKFKNIAADFTQQLSAYISIAANVIPKKYIIDLRDKYIYKNYTLINKPTDGDVR